MASLGMAAAGQVPKKETAAVSFGGFLADLATRAEALAARAENTLHPISRGMEPSNACESVTTWMPPLLDEYRNSAFGIEASIRRIENALDRLEI